MALALPPLDSTDPATALTGLGTQYPTGLVGLPLEPVRLHWSVASSDPAAVQLGYQVARCDPDSPDALLLTAPPVAGDDAIGVVAPGGPLGARERRGYRVRVATSAGWTAWGPPVVLEGGLGPDGWRARLVHLASDFEGATPLLRKGFTLPAEVRSARLHASGLGFYQTWLNGRRTDDEVMNPGWTVYGKRVLVQTWDVTDLLAAGGNAIGVVLGDGWYRGRLGGQGRHALWGDELAALVQLEVELVDGSRVVVASDETWRGGFGAVTGTAVYDGTTADLRLTGPEFSTSGFDDSQWETVSPLKTDHELFVPRSAPGVRPIAELAMTVARRADRYDLDAAQNLAGWVRLTVRGRRGDTVTIRHAEVLEPDGTLHTHSLRHARPVDRYTLGHDGVSVLEPVHTYHGFRYADVVTDAEVLQAVAVAVSCDLPERSSFRCSHAALTQFHGNARWSQRANFMSVPSDCPQRDERLGWTGDAAAFAATACTLVDVEPFWDSWLRDLDLDQREDGSLPSTVPNVFELGDLVMNGVVADPWGRAGWADAVTLIPSAVHESYGDPSVLREHLPAMRAWVAHLRRRAGDEVVLPDEPFQWGDWLDPDAPGGRPWESKVSPTFVANAFYVRSARLLAAAERVAGDPVRAGEYDELADAVAAASWRRWRDDAYTTQTGAALALEYAVAPDGERAAVAAYLARSVREIDGRIATGFVGARLILFALSRAGYIDEACRMLLRREAPSWLYQVDRGATTVWERWDAIKPDGSIHTGAMDTVSDDVMVSFNHYAYGSMVDWVYRNVAGLEPSTDGPGYRVVDVRPRPASGVTWAQASIETRGGRLAIDWRLTDAGTLEVDLTVPFGTTARLDLPTAEGSRVLLDGADAPAAVTHGTHHLVVSEPVVASARTNG